MSEYRDYGYFVGESAATQTPINSKRYSQVYQATHIGEERLPYMNRSFISFSYGGKWIEDFDLLAIIDGQFLQRNLYANFTDNVTESEVQDGQLYWDSHYNANTLSFALFTDGIDEKQLDSFKSWFRPGRIEELILAEHPNRAIWARIAEVPTYEILPFEQNVKMKVGGVSKKTSTTLYKGKITLNFIMDEPHWHSRVNILDEIVTSNGANSGQWIDAHGRETFVLEDKDALKVLYEDNVPLSSMIHPGELVESESIQSVGETDGYYPADTNILFGTENALQQDLTTNPGGSRVGGEAGAVINQGHVAYVYVDANANIQLDTASDLSGDYDNWTINSEGYFYYAGNAPSYPLLTFELTPTIDNSTGYIIVPRNTIGNDSGNKYNIIVIESTNIKQFKFTTPGAWTGYNQAIQVFKSFVDTSTSWEEVRIAIRDNVKHWAPRQYAMFVIDDTIGTTTATTNALLSSCVTKMQNFLKTTASGNAVFPAIFTINSENGRAVAKIRFRTKNNANNSSGFGDCPVENVGDMVKSDYLIIEDRNCPDEDGYISAWTTEHPEYCHRIYADCVLSDVNLQYKYMYL